MTKPTSDDFHQTAQALSRAVLEIKAALFLMGEKSKWCQRMEAVYVESIQLEIQYLTELQDQLYN